MRRRLAIAGAVLTHARLRRRCRARPGGDPGARRHRLRLRRVRATQGTSADRGRVVGFVEPLPVTTEEPVSIDRARIVDTSPHCRLRGDPKPGPQLELRAMDARVDGEPVFVPLAIPMRFAPCD